MFKEPHTYTVLVKHVTHKKLIRAAGFDPMKHTLNKITLYYDWDDKGEDRVALIEVGVCPATPAKGKHGKTPKGRKQ